MILNLSLFYFSYETATDWKSKSSAARRRGELSMRADSFLIQVLVESFLKYDFTYVLVELQLNKFVKPSICERKLFFIVNL